MAGAIERYKELVKKLLPKGFAWEQVREHPFVEGIAGEFCRVGDRAADLLREIDPNQTTELLEDFEQLLGIPDDCTPENQTIPERRAQIVQKLATKGSLSASFYEEIGAFYGFDITVTNWVPFQAGKSTAGDPLTNGRPPRDEMQAGDDAGSPLRVPGWIFYFNAELPVTAFDQFQAGQNQAGDPLRDAGNPLLECTLIKLKPAHTGVTFTFS